MAGFPNEEQRRVIEHLGGPVLVLAPVGTGKTMVMASRLSRVLETGFVRPGRALCVTFTNRAAQEMRRRVESVLGERARGAFIFTFHGLCAWILRQEAEDLGFARDFVIYDDADGPALLGAIAGELGLRKRLPGPRELFARIAERKSNAPWKALRLSGSPPVYERGEVDLARVAERYQEILEERNALDFADLIHRVRAMLYLLPEKRRYWAERFDWVQVDEVQDTHFSEYDVISRLARRTRHLAFFGDVDQTIYEWRGSNPDQVLARFRAEFGALAEFALTTNYRATRRLIEAADRFARSFDRRRTHLVCDRTVARGEQVVGRGAPHAEEEADWIARRVKALLSSGEAGATAILVRKRARAKTISGALTEAGVPHVTVEEFEFFRRQEVKDALARLRFILNPLDGGALHRITLRPAVGIGKGTLRRIWQEGLPAHLRITDMAQVRTHRTGEPYAALLRAWERDAVVVVDVESTGLAPGRDEVVEIGAVRLKGGEPAEVFQRYIRPSLPVGESERIHGYSDAFLAEHGEKAEVVLRDFAAFVRDAHLVGHNVCFDLDMLRGHGLKVGVELSLEEWDDTLPICRRVLKTERYDLESLAQQLGLTERPSHRALEDALRTGELLGRLAPVLAETSGLRAEIVKQYGRAFRPLAERIAGWRGMARRLRPAELLAAVLEESGLRAYYRESLARSGHLELLVEYLRANDRPELDPLSALQELTGKIAMAKNIELLDAEDSRIPVVTVHQAKGLEFDTVFVAGVSEDEFPAYPALREGRLEEERRLFYVAITRPKRRLFVSWYERNERGYRKGPSRFLRDLGLR
jgi:DNA helicase-2/ATP-dependent DNA helicase PcrA